MKVVPRKGSFRPFLLGRKGLFLLAFCQIISEGKNVKKQRIVIKIGSSSLTNSKGSIDEEKINDHVRAIAALKKKAMKSSSFRRGLSLRDFYRLGYPARPVTLKGKQAAAAVGQSLVNANIHRAFCRPRYQACADLIDEKRFCQTGALSKCICDHYGTD